MSLNEKYSHKTSSDTLSVASRTTSDYFPQSYKRPAPYLLWDDNIVPIHFPNTSTTFSCCRLFLGLLITFALLGVIVVISVAVYLGVITSTLMEEVNNEQTFDGRLRITQGDSYIPELEDSSSLEFQLKARKYETMLNMLLKESTLKDGYKGTDVTGFRSGSLLVFFRVNLDRRKVPFFELDDVANTIHDAIVSDAISPLPKVLKGVHVDHGSISISDSYPKKKLDIKTKSFHSSPQNQTSTASTETMQSTHRLPATKHQETVTTSISASNGSSETTSNMSTAVPPMTTYGVSADENKSKLADGPSIRYTSKPKGAQLTLTSPATTATVTSTPLTMPSVNVKPVGQRSHRPEALASGVAHEIAFSLDDLSFYEPGPNKHPEPLMPLPDSSAKISSHPMDANVAALLVLRTPESERNGKNLASERDAAFTPRMTRRPLRRPMSTGPSRLIQFSGPALMLNKQDSNVPSAGGGFRITSAPIVRESVPAVTEINANVRLDLRRGRPNVLQTKPLDVDFSIDNAKESVFSRIPPLLSLEPKTETPSLHISGEVKTQSDELLIKESKTTGLPESPNSHFPSDALLDDGWVTVPLKKHTVAGVQSTTPKDSDFFRLTLVKQHFSSSTLQTPSLSRESETNLKAADNQSDPLIAEEQNIQPTSVPLPPNTALGELDLPPNSDLTDPELAPSGTHEGLIKTNACSRAGAFQCKDGSCVSSLSRCNQMRDCPDNSDEDGCTCADFLQAQFLKEKICDGVVDCWDYSDENQCDHCSPGMYICPNSNVCLNKNKVCDSLLDCPGGEDEKSCVRVSANLTVSEEHYYHSSGYLMMRKNGIWGRLCVDNMSQFSRRTSAPMSLVDVARAVCRSLTFTDYVAVERRKAPLLPRIFGKEETFYEIKYIPSNYNSSTRSVLEFNYTNCQKREVAWIQCKNLECGTRPMASSARIVGGANALAGSWPWQAAMYKSGDYMCGATLINDQWLISAAHCFYNEVNNHWTARLGMLRRGSQAPYEQIHQISHIIIHPNYVKVGFINDVALLRLQNKVTFSDYVRPVCLPSSSEESVLNGQMCTVVGWGQLMETGHVFPDTLQEVELPVYDTEECRKKTVFLQTYQITENMFCAGYDRGGRDACLGDSGGPLVCQTSNGRSSLVGITSNGFGCARAWRPGIYTKVANYITWMDQVMASPLRNPIRTYCRGHRCQLGKCLSASSVCNGFVECLDGSDEHGCS